MTGRLVGMTVGLYEWTIEQIAVFRFEGDVDDCAYLDFLDEKGPMEIETVDMSRVLRDALTVKTGFDWQLAD